MNADNDDLRRLWQSRKPTAGPNPVPRFELLEDSTVPDYMPLSGGRRAGYVVGLLWTAMQFWQGGREGNWPEYVAWTGLAASVAASVLVLWERDRSPAPNPAETIQTYREALSDEFDRQFRRERRIFLGLLGAWVLVLILRTAADTLKHGTLHPGDVVLPVLAILFIIAGLRMYYRAARAVRSRLSRI